MQSKKDEKIEHPEGKHHLSSVKSLVLWKGFYFPMARAALGLLYTVVLNFLEDAWSLHLLSLSISFHLWDSNFFTLGPLYTGVLNFLEDAWSLQRFSLFPLCTTMMRLAHYAYCHIVSKPGGGRFP